MPIFVPIISTFFKNDPIFPNIPNEKKTIEIIHVYETYGLSRITRPHSKSPSPCESVGSIPTSGTRKSKGLALGADPFIFAAIMDSARNMSDWQRHLNRVIVLSCVRPHLLHSAAGHLLQVFGVPGPLHRDLRGGAIDLTEIVGRQFDGSRSDVFVQALQLRGARDRDDPRLPGKQPGERDLRGCRFLPFCDCCPADRPAPDSLFEPPA